MTKLGFYADIYNYLFVLNAYNAVRFYNLVLKNTQNRLRASVVKRSRTDVYFQQIRMHTEVVIMQGSICVGKKVEQMETSYFVHAFTA